jgi:hypothetical protein
LEKLRPKLFHKIDPSSDADLDWDPPGHDRLLEEGFDVDDASAPKHKRARVSQVRTSCGQFYVHDFGHFWHFWQFLAIFGHFWQVLASFGIFWQFFGNFQQYISFY